MSSNVFNATPQDCAQLMAGKPFSARKGSVPVMYFGSESECFLYADRQALSAFVTERDGSRSHSTLVTVREISGYPEKKSSPAEMIAAKVREQLTPDASTPLSPLAKERAVIILINLCQEKPLVLEAYMILFPYSNEAQFERLYSSHKKSTISNDDMLRQFASSRNCAEILPMIESEDSTSIISFCMKNKVQFSTAGEVVAMSMNHGKIGQSEALRINRHLERFENSSIIERSLGPSLASILSKHKVLARMVRNSNEAGAIDYIEENLGRSNSEAKDIYEELSAIAPMISN